MRPQPWESHTSHYTLEGLDSPAPPCSATPLIGLLGLTHCPFSIAKTRPTRPPSSNTFTEGQLPSHHCRQSQKHSNNSNITASTLPAGRNWQQAELPPPPLGPDQAHPTLGHGWQRHAAQSSHHSFRQELRNHLDPASQALLDSQSGPHASRAFTTIPFGPDTTYQPHIFRIVLLRRLRLALPLSARRCRCRRIFDPLGDHRSACAQAGVLRSRGVPLEKAAARVCREAGARVTTNTRLMDLNIDNIQRQDDRRIEVIANGLPLWGGVQLAIDTTLVSPLTRASEPRSRAGRYAGAAVQDARRAKERTYPELLQTRRCKLVVLAIEVGGRPGSHNLPTVAGPSKSPHHPSPAQGLIHKCLDPPVVCPNHPCSNDRLCGQSPGI